MFESAASWSLPEHLFMVSGWSANCTYGDDQPDGLRQHARLPASTHGEPNPQCDLRLDRHHLPAGQGAASAGATTSSKARSPTASPTKRSTCSPRQPGPKTPGIWNPLADFTDVKQDGQLGNIQSLDNFYTARARNDRMRAAQRLLGDPQPKSPNTRRRAGLAAARPT